MSSEQAKIGRKGMNERAMARHPQQQRQSHNFCYWNTDVFYFCGLYSHIDL